MSQTEPSTTFVDSVAAGFRRWLDVRGTSTRREFWYWVLFSTLLGAVLSTADAFVFPSQLADFMDAHPVPTAENLPALWAAAGHDLVNSFQTWASVLLFVPSSTLLVRRFRDSGFSPALAWGVVVVPLVSLAGLFALTQSLLGASASSMSSDASLGLFALGLPLLIGLNIASTVIYLVGTLRPSRNPRSATG